MEREQIMNKAIAKAVAEVTRAVIQAMAVATAEQPQSTTGPKLGGPAMKQPTFNWESEDKYSELKTFNLEVNNILSTYNTTQAKQLVMVKNWLGRKGLQFLKPLTIEEKIICDILMGYLKHSIVNTDYNSMRQSSHCNPGHCVEMMGRMQMNEWVG